jgi:membrane dipeptidase
LNRREFHASILQLSAAGLFAPRLFSETRVNPPPDAADLYRAAVVIDSLAGPFVDLEASHGPTVMAAIRQSGITAVNYTISDRSFEITIKNLALIQALAEKYPDMFTIVRNHSDISRAKRENLMAIIPGFQDTTFLEDDPGRIEMFRNLGVRIMQITYNNRASLATAVWNRVMLG